MTKRLSLLAALALALAGCSSGSGGGGYRYTQAPGFIVNMRDAHKAHIDTQHQRVGGAPGEVEQASVSVLFCPATGRSGGVDHTCDAACSHVPHCVVAWNSTAPRSWRTQYLYAGVEPDDGTVRHETAHFTLARWAPDQVAASGNGHPKTVAINGRTYNVRRDIMGGGPWPMWARKGFRVVTPWMEDDWHAGYTNCTVTVHADGTLESVTESN